jgi:hypothetical protein
MVVYVFGNGNCKFNDFIDHYTSLIDDCLKCHAYFLVCDFRGLDTLTMEYLKFKTDRVSVYHIGCRARYLPDRFKTAVEKWKLVGGFENDTSRDARAIQDCTHFLAFDFNSDQQRKSGTLANVEACLRLGKSRLLSEGSPCR